MFQPKARRVVPVLALTTALSLAPLADASAARGRTARKVPAAVSLLAQLQAQITSFLDALGATWGDAGPRMDDNG